MTEKSLYFEHTLTYTNSAPLSVQDVVDSLQALEKLSKQFLPQALSSLSGTYVISAELYVEGFEAGSFIERVLIKLFFKDEDGLNNFLAKARESAISTYRSLPGEGHPVFKAVAVSATVGALVAVGASYAIQTTGNHSPSNITTLTDNTIIIIGAEAYSQSPDAFLSIIDTTASADKKSAAKQAASILAPAKKEVGATLIMNESDQLTFDAAVISATPSTVDFEAYESVKPYSDVDLEIRATDLDSTKRGWAGVISGIVDRRVKLSLDPGIDPMILAGKQKVRADVEVTYRLNKQKQMNPVQINITDIIQEEED